MKNQQEEMYVHIVCNQLSYSVPQEIIEARMQQASHGEQAFISLTRISRPIINTINSFENNIKSLASSLSLSAHKRKPMQWID